MLGWMRKLVGGAAKQPIVVDPAEAMAKLTSLTSDAAFEDAWEAMDCCARELEQTVAEAISTEQLGEYPMHASVIWLAYTLGHSGRPIDEPLAARLERSIAWAFGFDENTVLLGSALGAFEALDESLRESVALRLFAAAGEPKPRRYWLLLKIRTDAFVAAVAEALSVWEPPVRQGSPQDEDYVYTPTDSSRMAGAFRQFEPEDFEVIERHFDLASPGAEFLVEAMGATRVPAALPYLRVAIDDERPTLRSAAERWIRVIEAE